MFLEVRSGCIKTDVSTPVKSETRRDRVDRTSKPFRVTERHTSLSSSSRVLKGFDVESEEGGRGLEMGSES